MSTKNCAMSVKFDKTPIFAGQTLRGALHFTLTHTTTVRAVTLTFDGKASTSAQSRAAKSMKAVNEQVLLHVKVPCLAQLVPDENKDTVSEVHSQNPIPTKVKLTAGEHVIPFALPLPSHLPSSFGGKYGYIYYQCIANMTTSSSIGLTSEHRCDKAIALIGLEYLDWHAPEVAKPIVRKRELKSKRFMRLALHADMVVKLEKSGFVPGENLSLDAELINRLSSPIKSLKFEIHQSVVYNCAQGVQRNTTSTISTLTKENIDKEIILQGELMKIPGVVPSLMRGCDSITVQYHFSTSVNGREMIRIPIVIGTVPLECDQLPKPAPKKAMPWKDNDKEIKGETERENKETERETVKETKGESSTDENANHKETPISEQRPSSSSGTSRTNTPEEKSSPYHAPRHPTFHGMPPPPFRPPFMRMPPPFGGSRFHAPPSFKHMHRPPFMRRPPMHCYRAPFMDTNTNHVLKIEEIIE